MTTPYQRYLVAAERRRKRILQLWRDGYTQTCIAHKMQVSKQRIQQVIASFKK